MTDQRGAYHIVPLGSPDVSLRCFPSQEGKHNFQLNTIFFVIYAPPYVKALLL